MPKWFIIPTLIIVIVAIGGCAKRNTAYQEEEWLTLEKRVQVVGDPLDISIDDNYIYIALDQGGISTIRRNDFQQKWYTYIRWLDGSTYNLTRVPKLQVVGERNRLFLVETGAPDRIITMDTSMADTLKTVGVNIGATQGIQDINFSPVPNVTTGYMIEGGYCLGGKMYYTKYTDAEYIWLENQYNITLPSTGSGLDMNATHFFVAAQQRGLAIYNRANQQLVKEFAIPGSALKIKLVGNIAYIASRQGGLNIVDISNPVAPVLIGSFSTSNFTTRVDVSGNKVAISSGSGGVYLFDVSNPSQPVLLQHLTSCGYVNTVKFMGGKLIVAARDMGILVYKIR